MLLEWCNFNFVTHLTSMFVFFIIFGFKMNSVSIDGFHSLREAQFHIIIQGTLFAGESVFCIVLFGMRNSEKFEQIVYATGLDDVSGLDKFLSSSTPATFVQFSWFIIFLLQIQHNHRMETEAVGLHRLSVDSADTFVHQNYFHRVMTSVDARMKKLIAKVEVEDDDEGTHIATPIKWLFFSINLALFLPSALTALSLQQFYILANSKDSLIIFGSSCAALFIFNDLRRLVPTTISSMAKSSVISNTLTPP